MKIKSILFSLAVLLGAFVASAQNVPKDGAVIRMENYELTIEQGQEIETTVTLVRSSRFRKAKIDGLCIQEREGLVTEFVSSIDSPDSYLLKIRAETIDVGTYPLIIKAQGKMANKVKQTMCMLKVTSAGPLVGSSQ